MKILLFAVSIATFLLQLIALRPVPKHQYDPGLISQKKCQLHIRQYFAELLRPSECYPPGTECINIGRPANLNEFAHMGIIGYQLSPDERIMWLCGASLISERFVLTAAHCLYSHIFGESKFVKMGMVNIHDMEHQRNFTIIERFPYPRYRFSSHYHDIGLLKLDRSVEITVFLRPACLYTKFEIDAQSAIAIGWGRQGYDGEMSDLLLKVDLDFFTHRACNMSYRSHISRRLHKNIKRRSQICAGSKTGADTCVGDSGGPLQIRMRDYEDYMYDIVGITSFGKICGTPNTPGVYTRVSKYVGWIEYVVWPGETP